MEIEMGMRVHTHPVWRRKGRRPSKPGRLVTSLESIARGATAMKMNDSN